MTDLERLIDNTFPLVEKLLIENGEFYPLASEINSKNEIVHLGTYDGDEQPLSDTIISNLKSAFKAKKEKYNIVSIFCDVSIINPNTNLKTDAISILVEDEKTAAKIFYPYMLTKNLELSYSEPWSIECNQEIFN